MSAEKRISIDRARRRSARRQPSIYRALQQTARSRSSNLAAAGLAAELAPLRLCVSELLCDDELSWSLLRRCGTDFSLSVSRDVSHLHCFRALRLQPFAT